MIYFAGISSAYAGIVSIKDILKLIIRKNFSDADLVLKQCLIWSLILFISGGVIGLNISEINTVIPAHYHGSIIAVSLSLIAISYYYCSILNLGEITGRMAKYQPFLYGSGQLLHIIGFAISGGYGALRKNPGTLESMEGKIYMGLMGLGGLISIIGGLFFVIIIIRTLKIK